MDFISSIVPVILVDLCFVCPSKYIPNLLNAMYGCTDSNACNYDSNAVYDDESCI